MTRSPVPSTSAPVRGKKEGHVGAERRGRSRSNRARRLFARSAPSIAATQHRRPRRWSLRRARLARECACAGRCGPGGGAPPSARAARTARLSSFSKVGRVAREHERARLGSSDQFVGQAQRDHDAAKPWIAVVAAREHLEREVDLRRSSVMTMASVFVGPASVPSTLGRVRKRRAARGRTLTGHACRVTTHSETNFAPTSARVADAVRAACSATSKRYAQSTAKGGVRGLWDADTDQIIFGTHQIAYRVARRHAGTFFPHQIERELTFLPYAQISEFTLEHRVHVTEAFYVPHGPAFDRAVSFVVDITLYNPGARSARSRASFRGRCSSASASTANPSTKCARGTTGVHLFEERGDRRRALVGRLARAGRGRTLAARTSAAGKHAPRERCFQGQAGCSAEPGRRDARARRTGEPAHLRRVRVSHRRRRRARASRCAWPSSITRTAPSGAGRCSKRCLTTERALHDTQRYFADRLADARFLAPSPAISRGVVVGQSQHAAHRQGISAGLGIDELAAVGHPGLARHVVVRPRLRLFLAAVQPRRARGLQRVRRTPAA